MASRRHHPCESSLLAPQPGIGLGGLMPCLTRLLTDRLRRASDTLFREEDSPGPGAWLADPGLARRAEP